MKIFLCFVVMMFVALPDAHAKVPQDKFLDIQEITTKSGIKIWLAEDESLPIISMHFSFLGAGAINDSADKQGRAQLLSNMLDEGAGDLKSKEFQKALSDHSIGLSFSSSRDHFGGQLKTLKRYQDKAFELLALAVNEPRFDDAPFERMKQANISRIKSALTDPNWIGARIMNDLVYKNHPYALNSGGTITSLGALKPEDLRAFKEAYLTKDRLVIGVMGDISADDISAQVDQIFARLKSAENSEKTSPKTLEAQSGIFGFDKDIPQTIISVNMPAITRDDPDYYAAQVFNYIFSGGGFGSRLMEKAREEAGLTYGIYSGLSFLDEANNFSISTSTQNDKVPEMMAIIDAEMTRIKQSAVSANELSAAQDYLTGSLPLSLTSTDKISALLVGMQKNERPITYLDDYSAKINAVTTNDIQRVAKRILDTQKATTVLVGQPKDIKNLTMIKDIPNAQ